jgi:hypothetical protein
LANIFEAPSIIHRSDVISQIMPKDNGPQERVEAGVLGKKENFGSR